MHTMLFYGAKGGDGCSTAVAAVASLAAASGQSVLVVDAADHHDMAGVLGTYEPDTDVVFNVHPNLDLLICTEPEQFSFGGPLAEIRWPLKPYDLIVVDVGLRKHAEDEVWWVDGTPRFMVCKAAYTSIRRAMFRPPADHLIVTIPPGAPLDARDVRDVLNVGPATTVHLDAATARLCDAGLVTMRTNSPGVAPYKPLIPVPVNT